MGDTLDPEMGALVHKEKARQQVLLRNDPQKRGQLGDSDGCGNISINSNPQPQRSIGQPPGRQNVTVITGPVINAANCR
jgi:hypothetical protein